jgi:hypothetical protein
LAGWLAHLLRSELGSAQVKWGAGSAVDRKGSVCWGRRAGGSGGGSLLCKRRFPGSFGAAYKQDFAAAAAGLPACLPSPVGSFATKELVQPFQFPP